MGNSSFESVSGKVDSEFLPFHSLLNKPIKLACAWVQEAIREKVREPRSTVLTTINSKGEMSSRVMAILDFSENGIIFATHSCSRKSRDIDSNPHACAHFYWKELGRQLSVSGKIVKLPHEVAKEVWDKRPVQLHAMSTASHQSEPLL
ncbi:MAG: pyridoxamine 5'-phosphate oxidase family protein, partial [Shewanella sp.]